MIKKPILSDQEKRNVLSAKKKKKIVLKNLLVQPFDRYWPELTPEDVEHFVQKFRCLYSSNSSDESKSYANTDPSIASSSLQNVHKNKDFASKVILGLRSAIRCVSSGKALTLFISSKIRPRYIVDQIIIMTVTKNANSRIFCVPDMGAVLSDILGFSCQCLALLDENEISNWSLEKSKQFPLPKSFTQSKPPLTEQMDIDFAEKPPIVVSENRNTDISALYLRKEIADQRAFIPHGTISKNNATNDFISLGKTNLKIDNIRPKHQLISKIQISETTFPNTNRKQQKFLSEKFSTTKKITTHHQFHSNKVNYLPLKVNRVQPNIEKFKNKKKNKKNKK